MNAWISLAVWILVSMSAGLSGAQYPPGLVYAPAWVLVAILMGIAAWMVCKERGFSLPIVCFVIQLTENAMWSYLYFGAHRPDMAFPESNSLLFLAVGTLVLFWRVRITAGVLMIPHLMWVVYFNGLNRSLAL